MKLRGLHPDVRAVAQWCLDWANYYDIPVTVTSGFRSWEEQERLRNAWLAGANPYPANRPGDSSHNWGVGWDSWVPDPYWPWWHAIRQYAGFTIYPERDRVHAELPRWRDQVKGWPRPTEMGWKA